MSVTCIPSTSYAATPEFMIQTVHVITAISVPIHILGLYIILFKTPKQMSSVKWYFVNFHTWIVLYDNSLGFLIIPIVLLPSMSGYTLGLMNDLGVGVFPMFVLLNWTMTNTLLAILAIFENRFFIICEFRGKQCWSKLRHSWLAAHYIFGIVMFIPMGFLLPNQEVAKKAVLDKLPCVSNYIREAPIFTLTEDYTYHLTVLLSFLAFGIIEFSFFLDFVIYYIVRQVKSRKVSRVTLRLQIKFLSAVLIQVLVPMTLMIIPLVYSGIVVVKDYYNQALSNIVIAMESLHGLLSTLTMIFVHHPYRMALFKFLRTTTHMITATSFPIHILGLYIVLFKTPKQMSSVKWYFMNLHIWILIYDISIGFLTIPFLLLPAMSGYTLGVLKGLGVNEFIMFVLVLLTCIYMLLSVLAIFENRFHIVVDVSWKRNWHKYRSPWLAAHYIFGFVLFIPMAFLIPDQEVHKKLVFERLPCLADYVHEAPVFTVTEDYRYHIGVMILFFTFGIIECWVFADYMTFYIIKQVKSRKMSQNTLKLQIKFLIAVLIQILVPTILMVVPLFYLSIIIVNDYYNQAYMNIMISLECFHGLFSTLTMIFVHHPYRTALFNMFPKWTKRKTKDSVPNVGGQRVASVFPIQN